jgi:hypothetical protein
MELFANFSRDAGKPTMGDGTARPMTPLPISPSPSTANPTASDSLTIVNGAIPTTVTESTATVTGTEPTSFTGIESLIVNGTGALTLQAGASDDLIAVSPTTLATPGRRSASRTSPPSRPWTRKHQRRQ